jgi:hypothetical protein
VKVETASTAFTCGHVYGTSDIVRALDFDCYTCDPDGFISRALLDLHKSGLAITPDLEEEVRRTAFRWYHVG